MKKRGKTITLLVSAFYLAGVLCAVNAVMTARTAQGAVAWSIGLVSFPFVAVPAYLVFGRSKFEGMTAAYEEQKDKIDELTAVFHENLEPWDVSTDFRHGSYEAIRNVTGMELVRGNSAELLVNGDATFDSILAGVAEAEEYVLFQFYMLHDDGLGKRVQKALMDKARAGVRVYILYDEIGSSGLPASYVAALREAGAEVSSFRPTQGWRNNFQLNFRNHRKMVVVDGKTGWIGGHNVGDEYLGLDPDFSPWRDTHLKLEGPAVLQLQGVILNDWYWAVREIPEVNWTPQAAPDSDLPVMIVPFAPSQDYETASLFFISALNLAKERIWLSAPYFVPDDGVMKALELAALRGVDVRILTTGKPDSWPVYLAAFSYIDRLRKTGIRFYAFEPGFLHEKVMLVDDKVSTVGTPNFDNRSFRLNFEVTAMVVDEGFAKEMEAMFEADFAHSRLIDPAIMDSKPFWWRLGVNIARLAAPVL